MELSKRGKVKAWLHKHAVVKLLCFERFHTMLHVFTIFRMHARYHQTAFQTLQEKNKCYSVVITLVHFPTSDRQAFLEEMFVLTLAVYLKSNIRFTIGTPLEFLHHK